MRVIILAVTILFVWGCQSATDKINIQVDMASLHDEGIFKPEEGDKLSITGNFNNWQAGEYVLTDDEGDWIYTLNMDELSVSPKEELNFKFVISSDNNRELQNGGWETIANRTVSIEEIIFEQPVFAFNEPWSPLIIDTLNFRVNMSNQNVLGYFKPDEGDKVAVTGSFNSWNEEGIVLEQQDTLIYGLAFPVKVRKHEPLIYKYIIIPGEEREEHFIMPNSGWEFTDNRLYRENSVTEYFNNQKRVLRVIVSEDWIAKRADLKQDDVLHLKLMWNGSQSRNYRLEPNGRGAYETALQIPESAADVSASVVINYKNELYIENDLQVGLLGEIFFLNKIQKDNIKF